MKESFRLADDLTRIDETAFIAPGAVLVGDVQIAAEASIWFGVTIRGDCEAIRIGRRSNIQDNTVIHADRGYPCIVGENVTVGHRAILHGTRIEDDVLVGMGAILMNGSRIGSNTLIGAGTLIPEGRIVPPNSVVVGTPGRIVRQATTHDIEKIRYGAAHYVAAGAAYRKRFP